MNHTLRLWTLALAALAVAPLSARPVEIEAASVQQTRLEVTVLNADRVYRPTTLVDGQVVQRVKPVVLNSRTVFDATPEYQEMKRLRLDPGSAEAAILRQRASDRFKSAIMRAASLGSYDLVAETGAISVKGATPLDITNEVIGLLQ